LAEWPTTAGSSGREQKQPDHRQNRAECVDGNHRAIIEFWFQSTLRKRRGTTIVDGVKSI